MIEARQISLTKGKKNILSKVNFRAIPNNITAIIGPNGAGKSTLLEVFCGTTKSHTGSVFIEGTALGKWKIAELAKIRAVMRQSSSLQFAFTVEEVVLLGRIPHFSGSPRKIDRDIANQTICRMGLQELSNKRYTILSGGEKQRVHLARSLAQIWEAQQQGKGLFLLDEPVSHLDLQYQHQILKELHSLSRTGLTIVLVLHDWNLALQYADQAVLLKNGKSINAGSCDQVLTVDALKKIYPIEAESLNTSQGTQQIFTYLN